MTAPFAAGRGHASALSVPALGALALAGLATRAEAQEPRRTARAVRAETPPVIDGRLDDPVWRTAPPIGELVQFDPDEGAPPAEPSDIRFLYDADHLYVGFRFYDSDPPKIVSESRERDAFLDDSDYCTLHLDTFLDRRNSFFFQINPTGSKGDALVTDNGSDFNKPWDGIWEGEARIDELGWTAELAIPFRTLNFDPDRTTWGMNTARQFGRQRQFARWSGARREVGFNDMGAAGDLVGLEGLQQGVGLDVAPFALADWRNERELGDRDLLGDAGLDAYYKLSPRLNLALTFNTDFAETEVDERQINLTRFPLFFPERRDFFLQDAGLFTFPGVTPFFSRRIGRSEQGEEVPILAGAKLTGRAGAYNVGVVDVQTDSFTPAGGASGEVDGQNLFAARVTRNVGERSSVGTIVTRGDPRGEVENTVWGVDAKYSTSRFLGDRFLDADAWFVHSDRSDLAGEDQAFGGSVRYPNDEWSADLAISEIQADFRPALGFVPRVGIREYAAGLAHEPRIGGAVRFLELAADAAVVTDTGGEFETFQGSVQPLGVLWESGESLRLAADWTREDLAEGFALNGVEVQAGDHEFGRVRLELATGPHRALSGTLALETGEFFDGDRDDVAAGLVWDAGALFTGELEYEQNEIDLPAGSFTSRVARLRARFSFTPDLSWNSFVQWDNVSDQIGVNSRLRWIPEPGQDVFLVFNETLQDGDGTLFPTFQEVAVKVVYTLRF